MTPEFYSETMTFHMLTERWLDTKKAKIKASTRSKYLSAYRKHIDPRIGGLKLEEVTSDDVNGILTDLCEKEDVSSSLFNATRYLLNSILKFGARMGYLTNVALTVESAQQKKSTVQILSDSQVKAIVRSADGDCTPAHLGILLSLYTGMRLGEVCALKRENVDLENRVIHVHQTAQRLTDSMGRSSLTVGDPKSRNSYREIPIIPYLLATLKKYGVEELPQDKYVLNCRDVPYEPRTLQYGFSRLARRCEFQELHYHCLRHTFATRCIRAGMDMKTLSEILGHANVGITMNIYVHSDLEQKRRQMKLLEEELRESIS